MVTLFTQMRGQQFMKRVSLRRDECITKTTFIKKRSQAVHKSQTENTSTMNKSTITGGFYQSLLFDLFCWKKNPIRSWKSVKLHRLSGQVGHDSQQWQSREILGHDTPSGCVTLCCDDSNMQTKLLMVSKYFIILVQSDCSHGKSETDHCCSVLDTMSFTVQFRQAEGPQWKAVSLTLSLKYFPVVLDVKKFCNPPAHVFVKTDHFFAAFL